MFIFYVFYFTLCFQFLYFHTYFTYLFVYLTLAYTRLLLQSIGSFLTLSVLLLA